MSDDGPGTGVLAGDEAGRNPGQDPSHDPDGVANHGADREEMRWQLADETRSVHGEAPVWVASENALWWVDMGTPAVRRLDLATGRSMEFQLGVCVTSLVPRASGGFLASTASGLAWYWPATARLEQFAEPEPDRPGNRFNDGKLDLAGRFWTGTMDDAEKAETGALYRVEGADGRWTRVDDGYKVTNGPAFSPGGRTMYHTDSGRRTIYAFDISVNGEPSNRRVWREFHELVGTPDGMATDTAGCLWIAFWDGACLRRFAPDATLLAEVPLPVSRPSSCCFAGPALDRLFVTSSGKNLAPDILAREPLSGCLFEVIGHGATGAPLAPYAG